MITVKQELERAEERIELVEYRSAERASEIEEGLESYVTKVRAALYAIQAWLHLYLVWAFMQYSEILRIIVILHVTLSLPNVAKGKFRPNFQISFSKIVRNK